MAKGTIARAAIRALAGSDSPIDRTLTGWTFKDLKQLHPQMERGDWREVTRASDTGEGIIDAELPIRSIFATQPNVNPDFAKPISEGLNTKAPFVVKKNGEYYLQDGHHRLTKAAAEGRQTAPVRLLDLDGTTQTDFPLVDLMKKSAAVGGVGVGGTALMASSAQSAEQGGTMQININGRQVTVSDNFRSMSPEEQDATVDEIAASMGGASQPEATPKMPQTNVPEFDPGIEGYNPKTGMVENDGGAVDNAGAFSLAGVEGLPVVGPTLAKGVRGAAAGIVAPFSDKSFGEVYDEMGRRPAKVQADNPNAALAGNVTGQVAGSLPVMLKLPRLMGVTGSLGSQIGMGAASNAALSAADTAVRGGSAEDIGTSAAIGGAVAGAVPVVGAAVKGVVNKALTKRLLNNSAKGAMSADELAKATNDTYKSMRDAGIRYDNNAVDKSLTGAIMEIKKGGYTPAIAEKAIRWLGDIHKNTRGAVDFDAVNNFIIRTNEEIGGSQGAERSVFKIIRKHLDQLEETAPMTSATPMPKGEFNEMRLTARALAKKNIKQRALQQIMNNADTYAAGREAGIRNGIGNLLRSKYGARLFPIGSAERAALLDVQHGRKALRTLSRFGFDIFSKSGNAALVPALGAGAGYMYGGPEMALALGLAGTGAKFASPRLTEKAMSKTMAGIRSGGLSAPPPQYPRLEKAGQVAGMIARGLGQWGYLQPDHQRYGGNRNNELD